jgi:hypothetical protein
MIPVFLCKIIIFLTKFLLSIETLPRGNTTNTLNEEAYVMKEHLPFANLTEKQLDKLKEAESLLNSQAESSSEEADIILLAFKQEGR